MNPANLRQAVPFFRVASMETSAKFYTEGLGFTMTRKWIDEGVLRWCWLERGPAAVMLQEFRKTGHDSWVPKGKVGEGVSVCFICDNAAALHHEFSERGLNASKPHVGNGMWVTQIADPDGYELVFESKTDAPDDPD